MISRATREIGKAIAEAFLLLGDNVSPATNQFQSKRRPPTPCSVDVTRQSLSRLLTSSKRPLTTSDPSMS